MPVRYRLPAVRVPTPLPWRVPTRGYPPQGRHGRLALAGSRPYLTSRPVSLSQHVGAFELSCNAATRANALFTQLTAPPSAACYSCDVRELQLTTDATKPCNACDLRLCR